jgi:hypothetical protein
LASVFIAITLIGRRQSDGCRRQTGERFKEISSFDHRPTSRDLILTARPGTRQGNRASPLARIFVIFVSLW